MYSISNNKGIIWLNIHEFIKSNIFQDLIRDGHIIDSLHSIDERDGVMMYTMHTPIDDKGGSIITRVMTEKEFRQL